MSSKIPALKWSGAKTGPPKKKKNMRKRRVKRTKTTRTSLQSKMQYIVPPSGQKMTTISSAYFDDASSNVGKYATSAAPPAADFKAGTRVVGCDFLANVGTNAGASNLFSGYPTGYGNTSNKLTIHPVNFPRLSSMALNFSRYIFREICIEYTPWTGSTTNGAMGIGVSSDSSFFPSGTSISNVMGFLNNFITPWWKPACLAVKFFSKQLYYTDFDGDTGSAADRVTAQGSIQGFPSAVGGSTTTYGSICVRYVCDFYSPTPPNPDLSLIAYQLTMLDKKGDKKSRDAILEFANRVTKESQETTLEEGLVHVPTSQPPFPTYGLHRK